MDEGIPGANKEEITEMIQEAITNFKKELLEGEIPTLLDATKNKTLKVIRKEFDQEELKKIM